MEVYEEPGWPELVPFLFQCVQTGQPNLMESALSVFATLASYVTDALKPQMPAMVQMLTACLSHANREVQIASLRAISNFIQVCRSPWWTGVGLQWNVLGSKRLLASKLQS